MPELRRWTALVYQPGDLYVRQLGRLCMIDREAARGALVGWCEHVEAHCRSGLTDLTLEDINDQIRCHRGAEAAATFAEALEALGWILRRPDGHVTIIGFDEIYGGKGAAGEPTERKVANPKGIRRAKIVPPGTT